VWGDWRDSYVHGTLVIWPPDDVRAVVNPLREHYDPASAAICEAHVTLTQPFVHEPSEADLAAVADVVSRHQPLEIVYGPLDTFLPYPCLFLAITPVEPMSALHVALQSTGLFHPVPSHYQRFVPHMTILEGTHDPDGVTDLAEAMRDTAPSGSFACREIAYIVPDASFRFSVDRMFRIGPAAPVSFQTLR
jgi:2'-5' RNA ligase